MPSGLTFEKHRNASEISAKTHPSISHELLEYTFYFLKVFVFVTFFFIFLKTNVYQVTSVEGRSMYPDYDTSDILFIDILTPKFSDYRRGEVVIINPPIEYSNGNKNFIKRIIALPGETVSLKDGMVYIYNDNYPKGIALKETEYLDKNVKSLPVGGTDSEYKYQKLGKDEYFLMGDNRTGSSDSRKFGQINKSNIIGKELYRSMPTSKARGFKLPTYNINN
jgi:signal peptidase I